MTVCLPLVFFGVRAHGAALDLSTELDAAIIVAPKKENCAETGNDDGDDGDDYDN